MDDKTIKKAAQEHAKEVLGELQFKLNRNAVRCISLDFIAGAKWAMKNNEVQ